MIGPHMHIISALRRRTRTILGTTLCIVFLFFVTFSTVPNPDKKSIIPSPYGAIYEDCPFKWQNEKLRISYYEAPSLTVADIHRKDFRLESKPVKQIYQNPKMQLNPDRFLLPLLENGPNNQLIGFRAAAFVAIKLNRTLVVPKFFKHFSDSQKSRSNFYIYPGHRVDVEDICSYVSCITIDQFQKTCGKKIDAIIHLHNFRKKDINAMETRTGMQIMKESPKSDKELKQLVLIPPDPIETGRTFRQFHADEIESLFKSNERCVIYPYPLYNLQVSCGNKRNLEVETELVNEKADISKYKPTRLLLSIAHHSPAPKYITKIAREFISSTMNGRPYLGVHWRYNMEDFMHRCKNNVTANKIKLDLCTNAMSIKPVHIALAIEEKILQLRNLPEPVVVKEIYVASPPSEREVVEEVARILHDRQKWTTLSSIELESFLQNQFSACSDLQKQFNDIMSTTEMEICARGYTFLGSTRSSWTTNVEVIRRTLVDMNVRKKYDDSIFSLSAKFV